MRNSNDDFSFLPCDDMELLSPEDSFEKQFFSELFPDNHKLTSQETDCAMSPRHHAHDNTIGSDVLTPTSANRVNDKHLPTVSDIPINQAEDTQVNWASTQLMPDGITIHIDIESDFCAEQGLDCSEKGLDRLHDQDFEDNIEQIFREVSTQLMFFIPVCHSYRRV